ncbi:MAG: aminodeoxychorismate synthase component I, partial [Candidatus Omnitrophota bacterium]
MAKLIKKDERFLPLPLEQIQSILLNEDRFVLFESQKIDRENYLSYLFFKPAATITCFSRDAIPKAFMQLEAFLDKGFWAAGFFSYEMGYGFENFRAKQRFRFPLIWLGIFTPPLIFDHRQGRFLSQPPDFLRAKQIKPSFKYQIKGIRLNQTASEYIRNIQRIKEYIAQGLTYQVNYTIKCKFRFQGESTALYRDLRNAQAVPYSAFIKDRRFSLLSFSPELFFRKNGNLITVRPMKGTISRGRTGYQDRLQAKRLKASHKDKSENIMIVDLLRNDLGRIAQVNSVKLIDLYRVEKYETLFQMTSTVQAKLKSGLSLYEIFRSIFPSGSVTGAPKIKTMEIIKQLEQQERKVYTGAIGFLKPNRDAVFNVAIRTLLLEGQSGEMGIGSGIVYDSIPLGEYSECKLKALFFTPLNKDSKQEKEPYSDRPGRKRKFQLIETMRWSKKSGFP